MWITFSETRCLHVTGLLAQPIANGALVLSIDTDFDGCMKLVKVRPWVTTGVCPWIEGAWHCY